MDGFRVAVVVAAMLIGFVALIALVNGVFNAVFGITFQAVARICLRAVCVFNRYSVE